MRFDKLIKKAFIVNLLFLSFGFTLNTKNETHVVMADAKTSYYDANSNEIVNNYIKGKNGETLTKGLSWLMGSTQTYITKYGDLKTKTAVTDKDPMNDGNIIGLYSRKSISSSWANATVWNREHVWCKSLSGGLYTSISESASNAGSDIHHLRPALTTYNSTRNNTPYGEIPDKTASGVSRLGDSDNYYTSTMFEPSDEIKGDIARILMYVYVRYSSNYEATNSAYADAISNVRDGNKLVITNIVKTDDEASAWKLLLKWNELDPVDYLEMQRNDQAQLIQGNRNVFIDHPEFATMCFGTYSGAGALVDLTNTYDETKASYVGTNHSTVNLSLGNSISVNASVFPSTASDKSLEWKSLDEGVAVVNSNGKIVALNEGTTSIVASSRTGAKSVVKVNVLPADTIFKYDGSALNESQTYTTNLSSNKTYENTTVNVLATAGNSTSGYLQLGSNGGATSHALTTLSGYASIANAIGVSTSTKGVAAIIFDYEFRNVAKINFTQIKCTSKTTLYMLYTLNNGTTYNVIASENISSTISPTILSKTFSTIEKAKYAFAMVSTGNYLQSRQPEFDFYSDNLTNVEIVNNIISNIDDNINDDLDFNTSLISKGKSIYNNLSSEEQNQIVNASKLNELSNAQIEANDFIKNYWSKVRDENGSLCTNKNSETTLLALKKYEELSSEAKGIVDNSLDTYANDGVTKITIKESISYLSKLISQDMNAKNDKSLEIKLFVNHNVTYIILATTLLLIGAFIFTICEIKKNKKHNEK